MMRESREPGAYDALARTIKDLVGGAVESTRVRVVGGSTSGGGGETGTGAPNWNPMRAVGDLIRGGDGGAARRLAIGTAGQVLTVMTDGGGALVPSWEAAGGASARDLLTNGDAADPQLIFAAGDVIWIEG
jgi:hypothetical protein